MKVGFTCILLSLTIVAHAQQLTSFTQYNINKFAMNPASAGLKPCNELNFGGSIQWMGFEGAPEMFFISMNSRLNRNKNTTKNIQGFGFYIAQEKEGVHQKTYVKFAYSYHFRLGKNYDARVGMFVGVQKHEFNKVMLRTPAGMTDPAFEDLSSNYVFPEISPGIYIEGSRLYTGLSIMQAYPVKFKKIGTSETNLSPHFFLMGGYHLGKYSWTFTPSFLLNAAYAAPPTLDVSFSADFQKKFLVAIGGKYANSIYFTVHLRLLKWLKVAYSYSYPISDINKVALNSQSITISISGCDSFYERPPFYCPVFR